MSRRWENEGQPMSDGRLCLVIDPEDGSHPLRIYGMTKDEVLDKAAKTVEHGARTIAALRTQTAQPKPAPRKSMTVDEQMKATMELSDPAKAPDAVRRLVEESTGLDFSEIKRQDTLNRIAAISMDWQQTHPEFPDNQINRKLILDTATLRVGFGNINAEVLEDVYQALLNNNMLVPAQPETVNDNQPNPTLRPSESPENVSVRPREATSYRRGDLKAPVPAAPQTGKYTRAQIDAMSSDELGEKIKREPGFSALLDSLAQPRRA